MRNTLFALLQEAVIHYPSLAAVREWEEPGPAGRPVTGGEDSRAITFADLYCRVKELGTGLIELGLKPGQAVVSITRQSSRSLISDLAVLGCRGTGLALRPELSDEALEEDLLRFQPEFGLAGDRETAERLLRRHGSAGLPHRVILLAPGPAVPGALDWDDVLDSGRGLLERGDHRFDLCAAGGLTVSHDAILNAVFQSRRRLQVQAGSSCLSALPDAHPAGYLIPYLCLSAGCTLRFGRPGTAELISDLGRARPEVMAVSSSLLAGLEKEIRASIRGSGLFPVLEVWSASMRRLLGTSPGLAVRLGSLMVLIALLPLRLAARRQEGRARRSHLGGRLKRVIMAGFPLPDTSRRFWQVLGLQVIELGHWPSPAAARQTAAGQPPAGAPDRAAERETAPPFGLLRQRG